MIDPADQKISDEAIKRNTNLTATGVRVALDATAIDFQRRVDARNAGAVTTSEPKAPGSGIIFGEASLSGQPVDIPIQQAQQNQNPFLAGNSDGPSNPTHTLNLIVVIDGEAFTTNFFTDGVLTPV